MYDISGRNQRNAGDDARSRGAQHRDNPTLCIQARPVVAIPPFGHARGLLIAKWQLGEIPAQTGIASRSKILTDGN
jgi:hypothetical protein